MQEPEDEHTRFVPQDVPAAMNVRSVHTGAPELHSIVAVAAQMLLEVHVVPCWQGFTVTVAVALLDGSSVLFATTWYVPAVPGGVNKPAAVTVPPSGALQVTSELTPPVTV